MSLVDAATVAHELGVTRSWVYENALRLGAIPLGDGPRPRLRFDLERVKAALPTCYGVRGSDLPEPASLSQARRRRQRATGTNVELLPIRGRDAA